MSINEKDKYLPLSVSERSNDIIGGAHVGGTGFSSFPKKEDCDEEQSERGHFPCPCCGFLTYPRPQNESIAYICPVCFWENDLFIENDSEKSDENHGLSLHDARENFKKIGACDERILSHVRKPHDSEIPSRK